MKLPETLSFKDFTQTQKDWDLGFNFPHPKEEFWNFTSWKNLRESEYAPVQTLFLCTKNDSTKNTSQILICDDEKLYDNSFDSVEKINLNENAQVENALFNLDFKLASGAKLNQNLAFPIFFRNLASSSLPSLHLSLTNKTSRGITFDLKINKSYFVGHFKLDQSPGTSSNIHTRLDSQTSQSFIQTHWEFEIPADSKFFHSKFTTPETKSYQEFEFTQDSKSEAHSLNLSLNPQWERNHYLFKQKKSDSLSEFKSLQLANKKGFSELIASVEHREKKGQSDFQSKLIATDQAKASSRGKVLIEPPALETDSNQQIRGLLLNEKAELFVKPELEVYADDVKANHGAAVGPLDLEKMFYLMSRGYTKPMALKCIKEAFVKELFSSSHPRSEELLKNLNLDHIWENT